MRNDSQPMLWWVLDEQTDSFSTLPTGPFLVPALIIYGLILLARSTCYRQVTVKTIAGSLSDTTYWKQKKRRYDELVQKSAATDNNLSYYEMTELKKLESYLYNPHGHRR